MNDKKKTFDHAAFAADQVRLMDLIDTTLRKSEAFNGVTSRQMAVALTVYAAITAATYDMPFESFVGLSINNYRSAVEAKRQVELEDAGIGPKHTAAIHAAKLLGEALATGNRETIKEAILKGTKLMAEVDNVEKATAAIIDSACKGTGDPKRSD